MKVGNISPDDFRSLESSSSAKINQIYDDSSFQGQSSSASSPRHHSNKQKHSKGGKKKGDKSKAEKSKKPPSIEQLNARRKKLWVAIVKKEIGRAHKSRNVAQKEKIVNSKKLALQCMKVVRQKVVASQRSAKEAQAKAKRLTKEMLAHWRHNERIEKAAKKQQEQEAEKQQKIDLQILEAKRQQRKLNFLITQTELYSHFMANKIDNENGDNNSSMEKGQAILDKLNEEKPSGRLAEIDTYECDAAKRQAMALASKAVRSHVQQTKVFDAQTNIILEDENVDVIAEDESKTTITDNAAALANNSERDQPDLFHGTLKKYQLKGMNWLLDLYDQGINGILADEMGLGKTVQSIAMLAHIAEKYNIWGPFLVISPASTLHNWQQEIARFLPEFKVVPYWGSPQERKILRHFWDQKNLHKRTASFHVVVTSYQLIVTDFKYFNRIKWQYMILDEAQAIKSSSSQRWKMLLQFRCRNRLLLSGTPIQNSMAELWSLLHFVMPTLFDSHDEFNDWFSKDIESSAESNSQVDETQISRLHLILKPFMLRRIKKDVENELTDKVEVLLYCPLTIRQKLLYVGLKRKIRIEELLQNLGSQSQINASLNTSLMNLVMQFRKVCNHPELFERRDAKSPFLMDVGPYVMPSLLTNDIHSERGQISENESKFGSKHSWIYNKLCIFNPSHVHQSLTSTTSNNPCTFSYLRFIDISPSEQYNLYYSLLERMLQVSTATDRIMKTQYEITWKENNSNYLKSRDLIIEPIQTTRYKNSRVWSELLFAENSNSIFGFCDVRLCHIPETIEHKSIRMKNQEKTKRDTTKGEIIFQEFLHVPKPPITLHCQPCDIPHFLYSMCPPKVATPGRLSYASSTLSVRKNLNHNNCSGLQGRNTIKFGSLVKAEEYFENIKNNRHAGFSPLRLGGVLGTRPSQGWSNIVVPDKQTLVSDAGKLFVLDGLLSRLKEEGHRVLIYSQMTKMIDLLEEFMWHKRHTFIRLDGSSKIHERRDMVADFQQRDDIFAFLLSTRAGGLGINLTAADTVIFYDSDWNPTVDLQAMDRAHRVGQTKQVTVYRLICKGTIEERILQRAKEKSEIQRMVIHGGSFKGLRQNELKPKEVVSLLLDDDEINRKVKGKVSAAEIKSDELELSSGKKPSNNKKENMKTTLKPAIVEAVGSTIESKTTSYLDDNNIFKRLKLEHDDSSNNSYTEDLVDVLGDGDTEESSDFHNIFPSTNGKSKEKSIATSPIFDFLGEKLGPSKPKRTGGKRGRPPSSNKSSPLRGASNSSGDEISLSKKTMPNIQAQPNSFKKLNRRINQGEICLKSSSNMNHHGPIQAKSVFAPISTISQPSSSQSSLNSSPRQMHNE